MGRSITVNAQGYETTTLRNGHVIERDAVRYLWRKLQTARDRWPDDYRTQLRSDIRAAIDAIRNDDPDYRTMDPAVRHWALTGNYIGPFGC